MMWLLPIIRPLPNASVGGPGDWLPPVVVVGVLAAIAAVLMVVANRSQETGGTSKPEHRDRAA
jgi:hypothetical protein